MTDIQSFGNKLITNLEKVIIGKRQTIETIVIGLLCQGHVLIEDVPGVGKTVLARSLAKSLGCSFNRLQFTPDMLPSDVTGVSIYDQSKRVLNSVQDQCLPRLYWWMKSTGPRQKPRLRYWSQWKRNR